MAFSWMSHSGMSFSVGTSLFSVLGRLKAGTVHGPGTCGMLRCGWETPQADRSRAPPPQGRPILRCLSWRARQLAGLQGRKPWEATLAGHKQNLVCTRTQEKGAASPQETDPDLPIQEYGVEVWVDGGLLQGQCAECSRACMGPFSGGHHYLHYLHHSLVSGLPWWLRR